MVFICQFLAQDAVEAIQAWFSGGEDDDDSRIYEPEPVRTCYDCLTHYCKGCDEFLFNSKIHCLHENGGDLDDPVLLRCDVCDNNTRVYCTTFEECTKCQSELTPCHGCRSSNSTSCGENHALCVGCTPYCGNCQKLLCPCNSSVCSTCDDIYYCDECDVNFKCSVCRSTLCEDCDEDCEKNGICEKCLRNEGTLTV